MASRMITGLAGLLLMGAAPGGGVESLDWLGGSWVSEDGDRWTEELWTAPRGGVMLGTNRSGRGDKANAFEFMRIADKDGAVSFWGAPGGQTPVQFRMTSSSANEAVFENLAHDYPVKIVYRRDGDMLRAEVSGPEGKNPLSWTFKRPK